MFLQVVGDECVSTNEDIIKAEEKQTLNGVTLTLAKSKTVSGFIGLWQKAESLGVPLVAVDENEVDDPFLIHLAVALRVSQVRLGGLVGGFANKYNELLRLEDGSNGEDDGVGYIGAAWRK